MKKMILMVLAVGVIGMMGGCATGGLKSTITEYDIPTGKIAKITVTEDTRGSKQDKTNVVGIKLRFPDTTGLTSAMGSVIAVDLGWINNDLQNTPLGMSGVQTKKYNFMWGNNIESAQMCSDDKTIMNILKKYTTTEEIIKSAVSKASATNAETK